MKTLVPPPSALQDTRQAERQMMTRAVEEMAAGVLQMMAEQGQVTGRFSWDGFTGDFVTSPLVTTLSLSGTHGSIAAQGKLRNSEWTLSVTLSLPEFALRPCFVALKGMLEAFSVGDLEAIPDTLH